MNAPFAEHFDLLVSCNTIRERQREALRLFVGRGRRYSVTQLHEKSGVLEANIENAMRVLHCPAYRPLKQEELASIAAVLGSRFVSHYLELSGLGAFDLNDQPPLPKVFEKGDEIVSHETRAEKCRRLLRELQEAMEGGE